MRYFLLDKVTEVVPNARACGVKCVTLTDDVLHDHFPDYPLLPGALLLEGMAQLAGFLLEISSNRPEQPLQRALLVQVDKAKFHSTAGPGDTVLITANLDSRAGDAARFSVDAHLAAALHDQARAPRLVARAKLTFSLQTVDSERVHAQRRYLYALWTRDLELDFPIL